MSSVQELKAELAALDVKIEAALACEKPQAIRDIQTRMDEWGHPVGGSSGRAQPPPI
ncbi:hypothetical protein [Paraburkholderia caledonica]|uniref:hypothetical protein n=1 Tax=Paraburkholderia caledonica TaxID=134536 RepID=UPI0015C636D0|nr:hypothetical protein [Paraburkholderia caledonica]